MQFYHVSYDRVPKFVLRVPKNRLYGEDDVTPRICLSTSIEQCVNAKPFSAQALYLAREFGLAMALYVYTFRSEDIPEGRLLGPEGLVDLVPDALESNEYWLLDPDVPYTEERLVCTGGLFLPNDDEYLYAEAQKLALSKEDLPSASWLEKAVRAYNRERVAEEVLTSDKVMVSMADQLASLFQKLPESCVSEVESSVEAMF